MKFTQMNSYISAIPNKSREADSLSGPKTDEKYLLILQELRDGPKKGDELSVKLGLSRSVVAGRLAPLVRWGCIREIRPGVYEITDVGLESFETRMLPQPPSPVKISPRMPIELRSISSHEEAEAALLEAGNLLGFDTYTADPSKECQGIKLGEIVGVREVPPFTYERLLNTVEKIDVIWFGEGFPRFCFEVEHTTGVRDGLLRLYQIRELNTRFFIVGPQDAITKFKAEILKDPFYKIKGKYVFKTYDELASFYGAVQRFHEEKNKFGIEI